MWIEQSEKRPVRLALLREVLPGYVHLTLASLARASRLIQTGSSRVWTLSIRVCNPSVLEMIASNPAAAASF